MASDSHAARACSKREGRPFLADGERRLSDDWRGWEEGSFDLTASHDGLGHVALRVRMRSGLYDDDWTATAVIWLDAGELRQVARRVAAFDAHQ